MIKPTILTIIISLLFISEMEGQVTFQKTYGGMGNDLAYSVQQTTDGGYVMTGYTNSFGAGNYDVYLIKTDAEGDVKWTKTFGGTDVDWGYSVQQTSDGGYIIVGWTFSFGTNESVYLIKTDSNGDSLWTKTFGGTDFDNCSFVQQTSDGGYIMTGMSRSFSTLDN
ncbi:MAG: hypothetical protein ABIT08_15330, partial [Bacteroidia bacterium]